MTIPVQKTIVIGVGNPFRSDDRVGRVVVQRLRKDVPPDIPLLEETGDGAELFDAFTGADCVILVDAVQSGSPPGTIQRFDAHTEKLPAWFS
ncbi:MAG TPA: hydrogenase maturation protease, partial [Candidatus Sulfotelmatobacter sp.]|nr:hydrogenase maturation protease [Candidatus Sulfotelmatobacter sp.]